MLRDWSLIMGRGGTTREGGGKRSFTPKIGEGGGGKKVLAMLKGGTKSLR